MNHPNKEKKTLTLKNFRVFDNNGASVELSPISILTGCNSSGKSSIVKALLCLNESLSSITAKDIFGLAPDQSTQIKFDFRHYPGSLLGGFKNTLNHSSKTREMTFEFKVYSHWLGENVIVSLIFKQDYQDSGCLSKYTVCREDNTIIYSNTNPQDNHPNTSTWNAIASCDLTYLRNRFKVFLAKFFQDDDYYGLEDNDIAILKDILNEEKNNGRDNSEDDINWLDSNSTYFDTFQYDDNSIVELIRFIKTDIMIYYPILEKISLKDLSIITNELSSYLDLLKKCDLSSLQEADINIINHYIICFHKQINKLENIKTKQFLCYYKGLEYNSLRYDNVHSGNNHIDVVSELWTKNIQNIDILSFIGDSINVIDKRGLMENEFFSCLKKLLFTLPYAKSKSKLDFILKERQNHKFVYSLFSRYVQNTLLDLFSIEIPSNIKYLASSKPTSQRGYSFNANDSFSIILNRYFDSRRPFDYDNDLSDAAHKEADEALKRVNDNKATKSNREEKEISIKVGNNNNYKKSSNDWLIKFFGKIEPGFYINKWLKLFEIGDSIQIKKDENFQLVAINIKKGNKVISIADEGFGVSQLLLTLFQIETIILENISKDELSPYSITSTLAIEEPEVHLHPKFQSLLADLIIDAYKTYNIHFIVETHSEYIIRKLQVLVAQKEIESDAISIVFIDHPNKKKRNGNKQVKNITIQENGILSESFGEGFYDEAARLAFELF